MNNKYLTETWAILDKVGLIETLYITQIHDVYLLKVWGDFYRNKLR